MAEETRGKRSLVTGQKIKKKSLGKIKKQHKASDKLEKKKSKKLDKKIDRFNRKHKDIVEVTEPEAEAEAKRANEDQTPQTKVLIVRKTDEKKPVSKKRKVLNFISYVMVCIVAAVFGYISGNLYVVNVLNKVNYNAFSESELRDDNQKIYQNILSLLDQGITIDRLADAEEGYNAGLIFAAAEYVLSTQENYTDIVSGEIQPSIGKKQIVWGYKNKIGSNYEIQNVSKGMLSVGEVIKYNGETGLADIYGLASISNDNVATFATEPTNQLDYDAYRAEYGTGPEGGVIPYIVSSKTIVEGSESVTLLGGNRYRLSFNLATDSSVINYIKQVKHLSGLPEYPTFKAITVTAVIDSNLRFSSIRYDEAYTVMYFGVMATCTGFLQNDITY